MSTIVGHIVKDIIIEKNEERTQIGGPPVYAALVTQKMRKRLDVITKVGDDLSVDEVKIIEEAGISLTDNIVAGSDTTSFIIKYSNGERSLRSVSVCNEIFMEDIVDLGDTVIISPVIGEVPVRVASSINPEILVLDPQGYVRRINEDKTISLKHWFDKELLEKVTIFKSSEKELKHIVDVEPVAALEKLVNLGIEISIATNGEQGAVLVGNKKKYRVPAYSTNNVKDTTGAGDVFLSSFVSTFLEGEEIEWCASVGSAFSSSVIETEGSKIDLDVRTILKRAEEIYNKVEKIR
jgi:sugar/nucleoside kinase (ribokinase family)